MYRTSTHFTHGRSRGGEGGVVQNQFKFHFVFVYKLYKKSEATHADAPTVERDFSACGNLLVPNRSRIDTYWVEMCMFL